MPKLSADDLLRKALQAGFGPGVAVQMVAIALRESGGDPVALFVGPVDNSYGLLQINMLGTLGDRRMRDFGLTSREQLFDPDVNFRCAFKIYAGIPHNLVVAWAIDRGIYQARYQVLMASALKAAYKLAGVDPSKNAAAALPLESVIVKAVGGRPDWLAHLFDEARAGLFRL